MNIFITLYIFLTGIILGSFYNVLGIRIIKKESLLTRSHCMNCKHKLEIIDLIPILNYFINKGKCRYCHKPYSIKYSLFELLTGVIFALLYLKLGLTVEFFAAIIFFSYMIVITIADIEYKEIPFSLTIITYLALLIFYAFTNTNILNSFLNSLYAFGMMFALKLIGDKVFKREALGGGDVKTFAVIGLFLSFNSSIMTLYLASFIGLIYGLIITKAKKGMEFYFMPAIFIASFIVYLFDLNFTSLI